MIAEAMEKPGFWILGCGGTVAVLGGWILARNWGWETLPLWQVALSILAIWGASIVFSQD